MSENRRSNNKVTCCHLTSVASAWTKSQHRRLPLVTGVEPSALSSPGWGSNLAVCQSRADASAFACLPRLPLLSLPTQSSSDSGLFFTPTPASRFVAFSYGSISPSGMPSQLV
ncbi:unnamed protein product [Protopolystoma xenopodis]|uniref:Uncharacterized protein n=1 Tax=Protopolystoma xenopodis TaxID=117903 RepID=A0A3S5C7B1_9PLAT|nr:unnamed protein product [Protopolystoma xenopodis]